MKTRAAFVLSLLVGCRFGGANGDALALVEPARDAGSDAGDAVEFEAGESSGDGEEAPNPEGPRDAAAATDGATAADAGARDAGDDGAGCTAPALPGCDPVDNQGCTDGLTQCVMDPESITPAGRCVFSGIPATPCLESALSTSCPPMHACVGGACRKFCRCDADCEAGEACREPLAGGVSLCSGSDG